MDAYDRCTNLGKKILPVDLPSMVEAEKFSDHPRITGKKLTDDCFSNLEKWTAFSKQRYPQIYVAGP